MGKYMSRGRPSIDVQPSNNVRTSNRGHLRPDNMVYWYWGQNNTSLGANSDTEIRGKMSCFDKSMREWSIGKYFHDCSVLRELEMPNFSVAVFNHMNNESQIGQSYQTRGQNGTRRAVLPQCGSKWSNIIYRIQTYIHPSPKVMADFFHTQKLTWCPHPFCTIFGGCIKCMQVAISRVKLTFCISPLYTGGLNAVSVTFFQSSLNIIVNLLLKFDGLKWNFLNFKLNMFC